MAQSKKKTSVENLVAVPLSKKVACMHPAAGVVNMHVLRGRLKITVGDQVHELRARQMLILAAGLPHAVAAEEESEMLLTVHLNPTTR
jgi:quercetin dioxygenase-like cupin family protein